VLEKKRFVKSMLLERLDEHTFKLNSLYLLSNQQLTSKQKYTYAFLFEQITSRIDEIIYALNLLDD
jgi:hypothetical protein